ncbi:MAG: glycoside hydrolase family 16 protein [Bacteroidetes bacterium]|nr:glycoside hydrolase family 16 protein [Bacteroidales bacterium]NJO69219.1 glycoside hydrolase family 16 protein [Bacteroidota bacterium]
MKNLRNLSFLVLFLLVISACNSGKKGYTKLVWADEFEYSGSPDSSKWDYEKGYIRNNEMQYYTNKTENVRVENGNLIIEAHRDSSVVGNDTLNVTSASLITAGKQEWTYGRVEVRAKIPSFLGSWPAIWMLGSNIHEVGWPKCGEIDIMENVGFDPDTVHFNIHTEAYNHVKGTNKGKKVYLKDPEAEFHVYAVEWFEDRLDFYLDSVKVFTFANEGNGTDVWPFNKPHYLILNLAVGGAWGGVMGVDEKALPQKFLIDYVRVYQ